MKKFFSILLSIFVFVFLLITLLYNAVIKNLSVSAISDIIIKTLETDFVQAPEIPYDDSGLFYPENKILKNSAYENVDNEVLSNFASEILENYNLDLNLSDEITRKILDDSVSKKFLNHLANEAGDYLTGKTEKLDLSASELKNLIDNTVSIYEKETGEKIDYELSEQDLELALDYTIDFVQSGLEELKEDDNLVKYFNIVKKILSPVNLIILIGIVVILFLIIFAINLNIFSAFAYVSIPAIIAGLLTFISGILGNFIFDKIPSLFGPEYVDFLTAVVKMMSGIFKTCTWTGIVTFVIGIVLCITGFSLKKKLSAR